ncbi:hypothetical protein PsYK624_078360 [Phanerochaete sordida]|uniref:Uncharacterized protein n=1 Tax=Phanerochaete sordida TaxID=48140 RepID=A0A9P3GB79_9APHY|nr:hypothetical protein PsYK624_078360 [Phanerochaete sordida]
MKSSNDVTVHASPLIIAASGFTSVPQTVTAVDDETARLRGTSRAVLREAQSRPAGGSETVSAPMSRGQTSLRRCFCSLNGSVTGGEHPSRIREAMFST